MAEEGKGKYRAPVAMSLYNIFKCKCSSIIFVSIFLLSGITVSTMAQGEHKLAGIDHILPTPDPVVSEMLGKVSRNNIYTDIYDLQNYTTRWPLAPNCTNASHYVYDKMASSPALSVSYDPFLYSGHVLNNVVAILPGKNSSSDAIYIVSGHYDSKIKPGDSMTGAPGADDDATGIAVTLETARIMSKYEFEDTVMFAAWCAEEVGLVGSEFYAQNASVKGENISAVLQCDMVGHDLSNAGGIDIYDYARSAWIWNNLTQLNSAYSIGISLSETSGGSSSDHFSFETHGFPAIMCFEADYNYDYHTIRDTIDKLNMELVVKTTKLCMAFLAHFARIRTSTVSESTLHVLASASFSVATAIIIMVKTKCKNSYTSSISSLEKGNDAFRKRATCSWR